MGTATTEEQFDAEAYRRDPRRGRTRDHGRGRPFGDGSDPRRRDRRGAGAVRRLLLVRYLPCPCRSGICGQTAEDERGRERPARFVERPRRALAAVVPDRIHRRAGRAEGDGSGRGLILPFPRPGGERVAQTWLRTSAQPKTELGE